MIFLIRAWKEFGLLLNTKVPFFSAKLSFCLYLVGLGAYDEGKVRQKCEG